MADTKKQNYLHGAAILAAGVIIMKILGAIYKIPLGNILQDEGYAHFLVAYNIYNVFLTIATAGLPVALSRMISEANTFDRQMQIKRTFHVAIATFFVLGIVCTLIMYLFPTELASMMGDVEASRSIWALSPAVLLVCLVSAYRGYCQGHGNMTPTTVGQVLEVVAKVIVGLLLAWLLTRAGKSLPVASAGAIFGVTVGGAVALIYMIIYKKRNYKPAVMAEPDVPERARRIFGTLLRIGIPITLGSSVLSLINLIDTGLCLTRLQSAAGFSYADAKVLFGVYGKAQTLYNLPAAFVTPLTISVVPAIASCMARRDTDEACGIAEASIRISSVIALPMCAGLAVLSYCVMNVLYPNSHPAGPQLLTVMGVAAFFVCMALIETAVLQAHGDERFPVYSMLTGGIVKILVNWVLVANPDINIHGAPIGTLTCYMVMCVMNFIFIRKRLETKLSLRRMLARPLLSTVVMSVVTWIVYAAARHFLGDSRMQLAVAMCCAIAAAVVAYVVMLSVSRAITAEDLKLIPKGDKLAKLLRIR